MKSLPLTLTKKSTNNHDFLSDLKDFLYKNSNNIKEKLANKQIKCDCADNQLICFDCIRSTLEDILSESSMLDSWSSEDLDTYTSDIDILLDNQTDDLLKALEG